MGEKVLELTFAQSDERWRAVAMNAPKPFIAHEELWMTHRLGGEGVMGDIYY